MKNRIRAIVLTLALAATTGSIGHAMSELVSLTLTPLGPTNSNPGNTVLYGVTLERSGSGMLSVDFSTTGLPEGTTASVAYDPARFTGNKPKQMYFLMTITATQSTPTNSFTFILTGTARRESISVTNSAQLLFKGSSTAPLFVALDVHPDGDVELHGLGYIGESYQIQATDDLTNPNWTAVGSSTADGNGRFTFVHVGAEAQSSPARFYRAAKGTSPNP